MRIKVKHILGQLIVCFSLITLTITLTGCAGRNGEVSIIPPVTSPLSRDYIGFGVITSSFTHLVTEPVDGSASLGYLRRGSLVRITRRQTLQTPDGFVTWVFTDAVSGSASASVGWLREDVMNIYNNESQARTASELMLR